MPRRREVPKREILPDPKYNDVLVAKFINNLMSGGKKSTAENIMYGAFDIIEDKSKEDPLKVFKRALDNAQPAIEVKSRRVGGSTYQVPVEIRPERRADLERLVAFDAIKRGLCPAHGKVQFPQADRA